MDLDKKQVFAFLEELQGKGMELGLERIEKFLSFAGNPERQFKSVHIAGTNGKGSTAAMIESILREAGFKTGLFTSPHLVSFNERIQVNGEKIVDKQLVKLVVETRREMEKFGIPLTYFEFITALAFRHFANSKVEIAVIETGMGGRLDATNVVLPLVSVITNVERDHEQHLGNSRQGIAAEKAGIIKKRVPIVTAEWKKNVLSVFREKASEKGSKLVVVGEPFKGKLNLLGLFQKWNAALAVAAVNTLKEQGLEVEAKAIRGGLAKVEWPGRFQIVQKKPTVVLDCAHNPACCTVLVKAFEDAFPGKKALLVVGVSNGKNFGKMARILSPIAGKVSVTGAGYRAMPLKEIAGQFELLGRKVEAVEGVANALKAVLPSAKPDDVVLVTGSCFVVGEALEFLEKSG